MDQVHTTMSRRISFVARVFKPRRAGLNVCIVAGAFLLIGHPVPIVPSSPAGAPAGAVPVAAVEPVAVGPIVAVGPMVNAPAPGDDPFAATGQSNPVGIFRAALERLEQNIHDYTCTFEKQELVGGTLTATQVMRVKFREQPFSVNMLWTKNEDRARRAIYVRGRWTNTRGESLAAVEPAGFMARMFVDDVLRAVDGPEATRAARRRIDQFGFANSLRLILKYCDLSASRNELDLRYVRPGMVGGRPTYLFERRLPYTGDQGLYPDGLLVVHLDQEYLLPTCCIAYADDAGTQLLGRYTTTNIQFNVGLTDRDFARKNE